MIPNSVKYVIILLFIFCLYYLASKKHRKLILLSSSLISLLALTNILTLILFIFISGFTYYFGIFIYISLTNRAKKSFLIVGIIVNIVFLFLLKYILPYYSYNNYSVIELIVYNIGVSYYILQCISYLYDIRHDIFYPEKNYLTFVLYLIFFPKFIQGPIERASSLIPQLKLDTDFNYANFKSGLLSRIKISQMVIIMFLYRSHNISI
jgi:D-alanyl-lipoteichoic acid acyltransferase DltB (MBOAT superfamily)